jgi:hypothetical protein
MQESRAEFRRSFGMQMLNAAAAIVLLTILSGSTDTRGAVRLEQAPAGQPYDFIVHVRNIPDIKYNPEVKEDRHRMALKLVTVRCPAARIVGESKINTEIWGITSNPPDYVVLVSCARKPSGSRRA